MATSCIISEIKRDIGRKSIFFHTPPASTPMLGGPRRIIWCKKTRILWLPAGEEILRICLVISTQLDRQRQTLDDGIDRVYADIARQTLSMQFTRCCCVNVRIA